MSINVLEILSTLTAADLREHLPARTGGSPEAVGRAIHAAFTTVLVGIVVKAAEGEGASDLFSTVTAPDVDANLIADVADLFEQGSEIDAVIGQGSALLQGLFRDKLDPVTLAIAETNGIQFPASGTLLCVVAPLVFGFLRGQIAKEGLDSDGLANLVASQRGFLLRAGLEDPVVEALGATSLSGLLGSSVDGTEGTHRRRHRERTTAAEGRTAEGEMFLTRWLPWIVGGLLVIGGLRMLFGPPLAGGPSANGAKAVPTPAQKVAGPEPSGPTVDKAGAKPDIPLDALKPTDREATETAAAAPPLPPAAAVAATGAWPAKIYFEPEQSALDVDAQKTIAAAGQALSLDASLKIVLIGFVDAAGDKVRQVEIAMARASAVRNALKERGIAEERIDIKVSEVQVGLETPGRELQRVEVNVVQ